VVRLLPIAALLLLAAPARAAPRDASVLLKGVPHVVQRPDFCGEACAEMFLRHLGSDLDQDDVFDAAGLDPSLGRGLYAPELARALGRIGFEVGDVWFAVRPARAAADLEPLWAALHRDLRQGVPSIICMRTGEGPGATEHFRLVLGYDAMRDEVVYHEPAEAGGAYHRMPRAELLSLWPLKYRRDRWTAIRMRLEPRRLMPKPARRGHTPAALAQHVLALRSRLPDGFSVSVQAPFVVIGDEPAEIVRRRAERTVLWAVTRLKRDFFEHDPAEILDVWLFRDADSYYHHAEALFDGRPDTPYGYYSATDRALVMNIATGGGTLVHEIVHPFIAANFPDCPAWFNEGLGSLYEQSAGKGGHIKGLTNWRLAGLQTAIRADEMPSLRKLLHTSDRAFYADDTGVHYAAARYLLYYLQERGLLVDYYHRFHGGRRADPSGWRTLRAVLGTRDMREFQRDWERWVLGLRFPPST